MRKSDILTGPSEGGRWAARTLASTNGLVWVRDGFGCYRSMHESGSGATAMPTVSLVELPARRST